MKSIAICLSGSLRSLEFCYKNFIENIINSNKEDFLLYLFYYLPDDDNSQKIFLINEIMKLNPEINIVKDSALIIPNCYYDAKREGVDKYSQPGLNGWLYQLQGIEECYKMVKRYEEKNQITFDYIARVRSDVLFLQPVKFNEFINYDITIPSFHKWLGINDRFAFGNSQSMKIYMHMYTNLYKCCEKECFQIIYAEWFCKYNLDKENIKYIENNDILFNRVRIDGEIEADVR